MVNATGLSAQKKKKQERGKMMPRGQTPKTCPMDNNKRV